MESKNALSIIDRFPEMEFNLLIPIKTVTEIADIQRPVVNTVSISTNPEDKEIYLQDKDKKNADGWALTGKGLQKLMVAAGIEQIYSRSVPPSTCQKCAEMNKAIGKGVNCSKCGNKDVKYECCIRVPRLTGSDMQLFGSKEIIIEDFTAGMSENRKKEFMRHRAEQCETRALNRALRKAMLIKSTYSLKELKKPFVVAYLVPNLENPDVKKVAIGNMFQSMEKLFGKNEPQPTIQQIESRVPEVAAIEASDGENFDQYVDDTYQNEQEAAEAQQPEDLPEPEDRREEWQCDKCGEMITKKVWDYSIDHYERPLCYKCQKTERRLN